MNNNVLFDGTASLPSYKMLLLIIAAGVILYLILSGKKLKITGIKAAGITLTVDEKESYVRDIVILDQPVAKGKIPAKLNPIKVRLYDQDGDPVSERKVSLSIANKVADTSNYISGGLAQVTGKDGCAVFSGLKILKTGIYIFCFSADGVKSVSRPLEIMPIGVSTDFERETFGDDNYMAALCTKIALEKGKDIVKINGEEIE